MSKTISPPEPFLPGIAPPWTTEGHANPLPWFTTMAETHPVSYDPVSQIWHFTGYSEVNSVLKSCDEWSVARRMERIAAEERSVRLLTTDPPVHGELRQHFRHAYRPRRIKDLEDQIRQLCRELLDVCLQKEQFDLTWELATPMTGALISRLLGVPSESERIYVQLITDSGNEFHLGELTQPSAEDDRPNIYMGGSSPAGAAMLGEFFGDLIAERRQSPKDDLVSDLARVPAEEFEMKLDVGALLSEQLGAGQHTTTHVLGSMMYLLDRFPDQQRLLRQRPELIPSAIEETIRFAAPLQARPRISTREVNVGGFDIPDGATALTWLQAANLDPRHFPDPTRFDITRSPNHHISFGVGEHYCLGAPLARVEARVLMEELLARTEWIARVDNGEPLWVDDYILRGPKNMVVEVVPS